MNIQYECPIPKKSIREIAKPMSNAKVTRIA